MRRAPDAAGTRERLLDAAERRVLAQGFAATSIDAVIRDAGVTKGAFFHHFASKGALARALVERYAEAEASHLAATMERAERLAADPLQQLLLFVGLCEEHVRDLPRTPDACLFASYLYEARLFDEGVHEVIRTAVAAWRARIAAKLREAARRHPPRRPLDAERLADLLWVIFEGGFLLARASGDRRALADSLRHYRTHLELLFEVGGPFPA